MPVKNSVKWNRKRAPWINQIQRGHHVMMAPYLFSPKLIGSSDCGKRQHKLLPLFFFGAMRILSIKISRSTGSDTCGIFWFPTKDMSKGDFLISYTNYIFCTILPCQVEGGNKRWEKIVYMDDPTANVYIRYPINIIWFRGILALLVAKGEREN